MSSPVYSQVEFRRELLVFKKTQFNSLPVYFGKNNESLTHFGIHAALALWRPDYSFIIAVSIETADTLNGRFDLDDWVFRLSGCLTGYLFKRFILRR